MTISIRVAAAQVAEVRTATLYHFAKAEQDPQHAARTRETRRRLEDRAIERRRLADTGDGWDTPPSCPARRIVRPR